MQAKRITARSAGRGFALVAALFLITIAAAIGMVMMQKLQYQASARGAPLSAARARQAAATGVAWASYRIARSGACVTGVLPLIETSLNGYNLTVNCARTVHGVGPPARTLYVIDVLAQYGRYGQPDYAAYRLISNLLI
jgi:MSHA biogenesis protein MshP